MYTRAIRNDLLCAYSQAKSLCARFLRFQYPHDYMKPVIRTNFPGPQHIEALESAAAAQSVDATTRAQVGASNCSSI